MVSFDDLPVQDGLIDGSGEVLVDPDLGASHTGAVNLPLAALSILAPESSSSRVGLRCSGRDGPSAGFWTPGIRTASTQMSGSWRR